MSDPKPLTPSEQKIVDQLESIAKKWPKGIWLFCTGNSIHVMRSDENREHVMTPNGGVDPDYELTEINGIDHDGGDW